MRTHVNRGSSERHPSLLGDGRVASEENDVNSLYGMSQFSYFLPELPHLPLQPMEQREESHARMSFAESRPRKTEGQLTVHRLCRWKYMPV